MPSVLLCVVDAFGGYADSDDVEGTQEWPQRLPEDLSIHSVSSIFGEKALLRPRATSMVCALCPSPSRWADISMTLPVVGSQVRLQQLPLRKNRVTLADVRDDEACKTQSSE